MPIILTPTDDEVLEMPASSALKDMASKMEVLLDGLQGEDGAMLREGDEVDFMFPVGGG
jgi:molybdopterin converting factor small subunit